MHWVAKMLIDKLQHKYEIKNIFYSCQRLFLQFKFCTEINWEKMKGDGINFTEK
jgi:hypothetical protein